MRHRIAVLLILAADSSARFSDAAKCQQAATVVALPSYALCDAATGGALNVETPTPAPVSEAQFCSSSWCYQLWQALSGISNGLNCLKGANDKKGEFDLSTASAKDCFVKYGVLTPAPASSTKTPTPTTAQTPSTTSKTPSSPSTSPGTSSSSDGGANKGDSASPTPSKSLPGRGSSSSDTSATGGDSDNAASGNGDREDDEEASSPGTADRDDSSPQEEGGPSRRSDSESATTGANRTTHTGPDGSPVGELDEESGGSSFTVGIATGGSISGILIIVLIFVIARRRQRDALAAKSLTTPRDKIEYLATLQSSRSRASADGTFAILGASGLDAFVVPNAKFAFWDDEAINAVRIPYEKLVFNKLVSRGGYGEVHCGRYRDQLVAIKTLLPERRKDMRQIESFLAEVKLMAALEHDHIVKFVGVAWDSLNELCVVSEFMQRGDLRTLLWEYEVDEAAHPKGFNLDKIKIALHVAHALTYMHSLQPTVLHRDLKSRNILLDADMNAKITDFGVSRERADSTMTVGVGSSLWMAPEVMMGGRYDEKADVFSFGVVLSELDMHVLPYSHVVEPGTGRKLPDAVVVQMMASGRICVPFSEDDWSSIAALGRECVSLDPYGRPSAAEVQHRIHQIWRSCGGIHREN